MNFYDLPKELITRIYEYDSTYHDIYKDNIRYLNHMFNFVNNFTTTHNLNENSIYSYKNLYKTRRRNFL